MTPNNLGDFFRTFRTARGITLKDAAHGLTIPTVSRFELGRTDISTEAAAQLMSNIGMTTSDLSALRSTTDFHFKLDDLVLDRWDDLKADVVKYLDTIKERPHTNADNILRQVLPWMSSQPNHAKLPYSLEQQLADLLAYPKTYGDIQYVLLFTALPIASHEFVTLIWQRLMTQPLATKQRLASIINYVGLLCVLRIDPEIRSTIGTDINVALDTPPFRMALFDTMAVSRITLAIAKGDQVQPYLDATRGLHNQPLADYFEAQCKIAAQEIMPWHNLGLRDTYDVELDLIATLPLLSGPELAKIRKQRHLSIASATVGWSRAAQSRFETGQSNLSFIRTLQLLERLEIPLSLLEFSADLPNAFENTQKHLIELCKLAPTHPYSVVDLKDVAQGYLDKHQYLNPGLLALQHVTLSKTIIRHTFEDLTDVDGALMQTDSATQDTILQYLQGLTSISLQELKMLMYILGDIDENHIDNFTSEILNKTRNNPMVRQYAYQMCHGLGMGPAYFQHIETLKTVVDAFPETTIGCHMWSVSMNYYMNQLMYRAMTHADANTKSEVAAYIHDELLIYPHRRNGFFNMNWVEYAVDLDYRHLTG